MTNINIHNTSIIIPALYENNIKADIESMTKRERIIMSFQLIDNRYLKLFSNIVKWDENIKYIKEEIMYAINCFINSSTEMIVSNNIEFIKFVRNNLDIICNNNLSSFIVLYTDDVDVINEYMEKMEELGHDMKKKFIYDVELYSNTEKNIKYDIKLKQHIDTIIETNNYDILFEKCEHSHNKKLSDKIFNVLFEVFGSKVSCYSDRINAPNASYVIINNLLEYEPCTLGRSFQDEPCTLGRSFQDEPCTLGRSFQDEPCTLGRSFQDETAEEIMNIIIDQIFRLELGYILTRTYRLIIQMINKIIKSVYGYDSEHHSIIYGKNYTDDSYYLKKIKFILYLMKNTSDQKKTVSEITTDDEDDFLISFLNENYDKIIKEYPKFNIKIICITMEFHNYHAFDIIKTFFEEKYCCQYEGPVSESNNVELSIICDRYYFDIKYYYLFYENKTIDINENMKIINLLCRLFQQASYFLTLNDDFVEYFTKMCIKIEIKKDSFFSCTNLVYTSNLHNHEKTYTYIEQMILKLFDTETLIEYYCKNIICLLEHYGCGLTSLIEFINYNDKTEKIIEQMIINKQYGKVFENLSKQTNDNYRWLSREDIDRVNNTIYNFLIDMINYNK
jgi:hypothetical protein